MRLILIWSARTPPHVQLWEIFKNQKGVTKIVLDIQHEARYNLKIIGKNQPDEAGFK